MKSCLIWIASVFGFALPALAQPYSIPWFAINGGAGAGAGGSYAVRSAIGSPEAARLNGGNFTLASSGLGLIAVVQTPGAPRLAIQHTEGYFAISWPATSDGWVLECANTLTDPASAWLRVTSPYVKNSDTLSATFTNAAGVRNQFFRLRRP